MSQDKTFTQQCTICNKKGLHARASRKLAILAQQFDATLDIKNDGQTAPATSIMDLLMLGAGPGSKVSIIAKGPQAREGLEAITELIALGFEEDTDG